MTDSRLQKAVNYSSRKLSTGFATAARMACQLTVSNAMTTATTPANANIHHWISIRYTKSSSHLFIAHQATGEAMKMAKHTNCTKSFESRVTMPATEAPSTLRMPISLVFCWAVNAARPNKPKHAIEMAIAANRAVNVAIRCSSANFRAYASCQRRDELIAPKLPQCSFEVIRNHFLVGPVLIPCSIKSFIPQ